jgi:hypothetical protein
MRKFNQAIASTGPVPFIQDRLAPASAMGWPAGSEFVRTVLPSESLVSPGKRSDGLLRKPQHSWSYGSAEVNCWTQSVTLQNFGSRMASGCGT